MLCCTGGFVKSPDFMGPRKLESLLPSFYHFLKWPVTLLFMFSKRTCPESISTSFKPFKDYIIFDDVAFFVHRKIILLYESGKKVFYFSTTLEPPKSKI
jgi:hypothetical protein